MNIVTVMNFIRGCEPRDPNKDLLEAPIHQNELHKKYGFPNTFLLQTVNMFTHRQVRDALQ